MGDEREVVVEYGGDCPRCAEGPHPVELVAGLSRGTLLFGGPGDSSTTLMATAPVVCPTTGEPYSVTVSVPARASERVQSVRVAGGSVAGADDRTAVAEAPPPETPDWRETDMADWRKTSVAQARDAASKLLGGATAAVGAYVTILKYIGGETVTGYKLAVAVVPAVAYAIVGVLAAIALRPVLMRVYGPDDFERRREAHLARLNRLLGYGVGIFAAGTGLAVVAYVVVWP